MSKKAGFGFARNPDPIREFDKSSVGTEDQKQQMSSSRALPRSVTEEGESPAEPQFPKPTCWYGE